MQLDASVTNVSQLKSISVSTAHNTPSGQAVINAISHTLNIGDSIEVQLGYQGSLQKVFSGYVKQIELNVPDNTYIITANDVMVKAIDYFIASANPEAPFSRFNIDAEDLVQDLMELADLTSYTADTTNFTFAIYNPMEINLVSVYDICNTIADILAYNLWADANGQIHFEDRRPYPMGGDSSIGTIDDTNLYNIIQNTYRQSDRDLRNRVVVYGAPGIYAEDSSSSPYLPSGFYKTVVVASQWIDSQTMANNSASYNLAKLNRLTEEVAVEVMGDPDYVARQVLTVDEDFTGVSGAWYIYSCEHRWSDAGYVTNMELRK